MFLTSKILDIQKWLENYKLKALFDQYLCQTQDDFVQLLDVTLAASGQTFAAKYNTMLNTIWPKIFVILLDQDMHQTQLELAQLLGVTLAAK